MNTKHLKKGDELPSSSSGRVRFYNMRYCPFAKRTRMVLWHKKIPHDVININLKDKPDWFFDKNPFGTVPAIERDNDIIFESAVCNNFLEEEYEGASLIPSCKKQRYHERMLMDAFGSVIPKIHTIVTGQNIDEAIENFMKSFQHFEKEIANRKFFGGDEISMLDIHIWPFIQKISVFEEIKEMEILKKLPNTSKWISNMLTVDCVQKTHTVGLNKYLHDVILGEKVDYDYKIEDDPILEA
ncbi:DgyrCDS4886 [Dimorphilus gyrociliatus]|uniref:Glutathione S-transferase omega n=1 Tax=Dimorphilus gyrociliatus TaxID=2664684 RepID=A0A7I8VKX6_9ANNE|nr:DgyrCDS4886 [Dimorphilus gyrociliatus]